MQLIDPDREIASQEVSYKGGVRSASLMILDRFRLEHEGTIFTTRELNEYVRRNIKTPASRRRKIVAAVLSAGIRNGWTSHISIGYWSFTDRAKTAFAPTDPAAQ